MCPNVAVEALDALLKTQFVTGLKNKKLSQKVKNKQLKQECNKKQFNINDAIQHAINKSKAFDLTTNNLENGSIISRNECKKDTQSDYTSKQSINVIKANFPFNEHNKYQKLNVNIFYVNINKNNLNSYNLSKYKYNRYNENSKINNKTYNRNENKTINNIINPLKKKIKRFALFNRTLVKYLYDTGAITTIIQ
jgi:hypothetical protein